MHEAKIDAGELQREKPDTTVKTRWPHREPKVDDLWADEIEHVSAPRVKPEFVPFDEIYDKQPGPDYGRTKMHSPYNARPYTGSTTRPPTPEDAERDAEKRKNIAYSENVAKPALVLTCKMITGGNIFCYAGLGVEIYALKGAKGWRAVAKKMVKANPKTYGYEIKTRRVDFPSPDAALKAIADEDWFFHDASLSLVGLSFMFRTVFFNIPGRKKPAPTKGKIVRALSNRHIKGDWVWDAPKRDTKRDNERAKVTFPKVISAAPLSKRTLKARSTEFKPRWDDSIDWNI